MSVLGYKATGSVCLSRVFGIPSRVEPNRFSGERVIETALVRVQAGLSLL